MAIENVGPGGVSNSYGVRTASTEALANAATPKNTYNEFGGGVGVTASQLPGGGVAVGDFGLYRRLRIASAVPVTLTGTTVETTLAHIKIPGGSMGPNGKITIRAAWSMNNNANTKRGRVNFGGPAGTNATYVAGLSSVAYLTIVPECVVYNRNSQTSQVASPANTVSQTGTTAPKTLNVDTTVDQYLDITGELTSSLDTITLEWYEVVVEYGA